MIHNNGSESNAPHTLKFIKTTKVRKGYLTNTCAKMIMTIITLLTKTSRSRNL